MPIRFGVAGNWESPTDVRVAAGGTWKRVSTVYVAAGGVWEDAWDYDVVGPSAVTSFTATWDNSSGNKCIVSYRTPTDADFDYVALYVNRSGSSSGPWTLIGNYSNNPNVVRTVNDTTVTMTTTTTHAPSGFNTASSVHYYRAVPYDTLGNAGTASVVGSKGAGSSVTRGMLSSPYYVTGTDSRTWRGSWATSGNAVDSTGLPERGIQGYTSAGQHWGYYWYDTKRTGIVATTFECWMARTDNGFNTATPHFYISQAPSSLVAAGSNPTGYSGSGLILGTDLNNSVTSPFITSTWHDLPVSWWTHLMDGTTWKSILMYTGETAVASGYSTSSDYLVYFSVNEGGYGISGGMLRAYHSG